MMERIQDVASLDLMVNGNLGAPQQKVYYLSINTRDLLESRLPVLHLMNARKGIEAERGASIKMNVFNLPLSLITAPSPITVATSARGPHWLAWLQRNF
jgi:hypothetical protein